MKKKKNQLWGSSLKQKHAFKCKRTSANTSVLWQYQATVTDRILSNTQNKPDTSQLLRFIVVGERTCREGHQVTAYKDSTHRRRPTSSSRFVSHFTVCSLPVSVGWSVEKFVCLVHAKWKLNQVTVTGHRKHHHQRVAMLLLIDQLEKLYPVCTVNKPAGCFLNSNDWDQNLTLTFDTWHQSPPLFVNTLLVMI